MSYIYTRLSCVWARCVIARSAVIKTQIAWWCIIVGNATSLSSLPPVLLKPHPHLYHCRCHRQPQIPHSGSHTHIHTHAMVHTIPQSSFYDGKSSISFLVRYKRTIWWTFRINKDANYIQFPYKITCAPNVLFCWLFKKWNTLNHMRMLHIPNVWHSYDFST